MKLYIVILLVLLQGWIGDLFSQDLQYDSPLKGQWKFTIGDNKEWAQKDYDDSDWEKIYVPKSWEDQGFNGYDGYAWYRTTFEVDNDLQSSILWIELGFIDDVDEVFINGHKIGQTGSFPPNFQTAYNAHRLYQIPSGVLLYGEDNQIAIRVYDAYNVGGIFSGNIVLWKERNPLLMDMDLQGKWKFKKGDRSNYAAIEYDDEDWKTIMVPGAWEDQGYRYYDGFAWYRKTINVPDHLVNQQLVLILGKIDDVDEVYVNGELIGQTGELPPKPFLYNNAYLAPRGYLIPNHLLKKTNTIAIRVYDDRLTGGIYEGPVGVITQEKYIQFWKGQRNN